MSSRNEPPISLADVIGDEAAQVTENLVSILLMSNRRCTCAENPNRCQVSAENGRVHVEFDPNQRCERCGAPPRLGNLQAPS